MSGTMVVGWWLWGHGQRGEVLLAGVMKDDDPNRLVKGGVVGRTVRSVAMSHRPEAPLEAESSREDGCDTMTLFKINEICSKNPMRRAP